jgi:hypothetical protein
MSLQTGGQLARTKAPLIDPRNLMIIAYELEGPSLDEQPSFLRMADVRELSNLGLIVDSSDEFVGLDDVLKIREVYDFGFELIGKLVLDEHKHKLGKVTGYSIEPGSFMIKQLNVRRPLLKSLTDTELLIDRTQITEVNDTEVIVKNDERQPEPVKHTAKNFANPFRGTTPQPEAIDRSES